MAELYQVATGSKKISNLTSISGISGSAVIPVVMSNVVGSTYPITNGTTNQISYQDFRESVIENNANVFTVPQTIQIGSGNSQQNIALAGFEFAMTTGSIGGVSSVAEGVKLEVFGQGTNAGVRFFAFDNTDATPANRFKTFMTLGTGNSNLTLTRNVITTGNLNVAGNLGLGGNLNINQDLIVGGTITAQSYNTEFISASIIYDSGSTKFGDTIDDTHERTGSLLVSGASAVDGNLSVSGIVQNALLGAVTSSLITQNISQNGVNLLLSAQTASQGSINTLTFAVTSSLINIVGGLQAYTASLKGQAIVSSSQQIQNYNLFAVTSSGNTFYGNQSITGSLSLSNGQFNVTTGSGQLTSSLTFTHNITAPNDGNATLELRHNNDLYNDDIAIKLKADFAGAYIDYEEDGTPYSVLSVQSFANKNLYIHQDTRLLFSNLTVDENLIVKQNAQITGSLIVSGGITGSILATNGVVSSSNQLVELNTFTGSISTSTSNINNFTASQIAVNNGIAAVTASLNSFTSSQLAVNTLTEAVTSSLITIVGGLQAYTASLKSVGIVSSSNQLFELNNQTGSQNSINTLTQAVTSSLIGIVGGLQAYTASLKGEAIVSSSTQIENYFLFAETSSANTFYGNQTISGSLTVTASANLSGSVVINGITYPTLNFGDGQYGVEVPTLGVNNVFTMEIPRTIYEYVKNDSGAFLAKGTPVHSTGTTGFNTLVIAASASVASTMPATFILAQDLDDEEEGLGIAIGAIQGVDTTGLTAGDPVWVGANGGWTQTKPTGSNLIQNLGIVTKVGSNGGGVVLGAGRSNDVPNIAEGYLWVGNSGSVATPMPTSSFAVTSSANTFYGNQTISGSVLVSGSIIPNTGAGSFTSSFSLGSSTNAWGDIWVGNGSVKFVNPSTGATASIALDANNQLSLENSSFTKGLKVTGSVSIVGNQSITGSINANNGITGSFKGNLAGVADYASTIVVVNTGTTTDTTLYPTFTTSPILAQYTSLYSHASSSFFYNGVTRRLHMEGLVVSGSNNNVEISGSFNVSGSTNLTGSVTINESRIDNGWTAYTPQWTAASSNPAINNGTIEGYYKVIGKTCFVRGNIAMGSTTTFGTGEWYVSMPFTASHADAILMSANLLDNGSGWYNATMAGARAGFNHKAPIQYQTAGGTAGDVNATAPFTWASTDRFMWNGSYEIA